MSRQCRLWRLLLLKAVGDIDTQRHRSKFRWLGSLTGTEQGLELRHQVCWADMSNVDLGAKLLDGTPTAPVALRAAYKLAFETIPSLVVVPGMPMLYLPQNPAFTCDAIVVSADTAHPIVLLECSVKPATAARFVKTVHGWFRPGGIVAQIQAKFPGRSVKGALLCLGTYIAPPGGLNKSALSLSRGMWLPLPDAKTCGRRGPKSALDTAADSSATATTPAKRVGDAVVVVDRAGMLGLDLLF